MSGSGPEAATGPAGGSAVPNPSDGPAAAGSAAPGSEQAWKLTFPCTRTEAEAIAAAEIEGAALVATEEDEATGRWRLDAYFEGEPDADTLARVRALAVDGGTAEPAPLAAAEWVTLSQAGLEPVRAGRFVVHTAAHPVDAPPFGRVFRIEAGQAFGTGHHETTAGCLAMLDLLATEGQQFRKVIDLGTGTGLLAFAAVELWPMADVTATDVDPIAIDVTRENAELNDVEIGDDIGEVSLIVADGTRDPRLQRWAPYDLVIANILAAPLVAMAPDIAAIAAPGATLVLAGLLETQADAVEAAYRAVGCAPERRELRDDWAILTLRAA